ncbi:MAG TPA: GMC family oxidoreductase, partial [Pseudonocardiaceae bacterium]|nr:GMC family oxidoreductase [Pseudonocardiaceae bacterium]
RITLADETDSYGQPIARMDYTLSDNDKANMAYSTRVITDILHAADAQDVLTIQRFAHLIGGARMGSDAEHSVVDANQRAWAVPNLFLADGSVCPTQGSANPALTIMALASRLAHLMATGAAMNDDPAVRAGRIRSVAGSRR